MKETILQSAYSTKDIVIFDRGLQNRSTFANFSNEHILFVTRLKLNSSFEVLQTCSNCQNRKTDSLTLLSDQIVYLCSHSRIVKKPFRLIRAVQKINQEEIWFLTNHLELPAKQITTIYRKRWEIERFFRFIKQNLCFSNLLCRHLNGIKIMVYLTMIAAMMLLGYKKQQNIKSLKQAKIKFGQELEILLIKELILHCNGNPEMID